MKDENEITLTNALSSYILPPSSLLYAASNAKSRAVSFSN